MYATGVRSRPRDADGHKCMERVLILESMVDDEI